MNLTTAKIVGSAAETSWSQVHIFRPEDEIKLNSHGELLAAISFKAKQEIEINAFGLEIIKRLQEIYYSNEADSILKKVSQSLETLAAEFLDQVELEIVVMIVWENYLYAGRFGQGQVWLKRADNLVPLLGTTDTGVTTVSGELLPGDWLVAATAQFNDLIPEGGLKAAVSQETVNLAGETLTASIHSHDGNSRAAAAIVQVEPMKPKKAEIIVENYEKKNSPLAAILPAAQKFFAAVKEKLPKRQLDVFLAGSGRKRRSALTVSLILLLIFGLSVALAGQKKSREGRMEVYNSLVEEVSYKLDEASGLMTLNPLRAKTLLQESQVRLDDYLSQPGVKETDELKNLKDRLTEALNQVEREYRSETADEWYDFDLVKDGFRGQMWDLTGKDVLVYDPAATAVVLNLESKAASIVASGEELSRGVTVGFTDNRGFVVSDNQVSVIDTAKEKILSATEGENWGKVIAANGFGSNLYLLDAVSGGQIWKYLGLDEGLSSQREYLKGKDLDLSEAVDMAIDGSVWVLFSDGSIAKYTQGVKDAFAIVGLDQPLAESGKIFTSPDVEHVYLLDRANTRVVVLDKSGEYQAQYIWPGIAGVRDFAASEELGKIFFLTGEKVFTVTLKQ
jgi:hypothetical protein